MDMLLRHQNTMLAVRQEMGWPLIKPANDCILWASGRLTDLTVGMELGRFATMTSKDIIYSNWSSCIAKEPAGFTIAYRGLLTVDIVSHLTPYAANDEVPIILASTRENESFAIDIRGSLIRETGKVKDLGRGRKLAMRRIKAAAAIMGEDVLPSNRSIRWGTGSIEPETAPLTPVLRFA